MLPLPTIIMEKEHGNIDGARLPEAMANAIKAMLSKLGIEQLSPMQRMAVDAIGRGRGDVVVVAPTGTGKTLAYLLPLATMVDAGIAQTQALVIVPGRELALQSDQVLRSMGSGLCSMSCYGGRAAMDEHRLMKRATPQIVFGTPGRLNDHIDKGNIKVGAIRYVVIDEFDKCLAMGFRDEMTRLIGKLKRVRRRFLLSATDADEIPSFVAMRGVRRIDYTGHEEEGRVTLHEVRSPAKDKLATLSALLRSMGSASSIVFVNYRDAVERVAAHLRDEGFSVAAFHGALEQSRREEQLYMFENKSANILVGTDLASRGLDIPDVDNIVHYHLPESQEAYIHRVGRTARWDAHGQTFFVLGPEESIPDYVEGTAQSFSLPPVGQLPPVPRPLMSTIYIGKGKRDKISRGDIVGFLCKKGGLKADDIGRVDVFDRYAYAAVRRDKLPEVLRLTAGEKIKGIKTVVEEVGRQSTS